MCLCCVQPGNTPFLRKDMRVHSSLLRTFATLPSLTKLPFDFTKVKFKGSKRCIQKQRRRFLSFISRLCFSVRQTKCNTYTKGDSRLSFHKVGLIDAYSSSPPTPRLLTCASCPADAVLPAATCLWLCLGPFTQRVPLVSHKHILSSDCCYCLSDYLLNKSND